VNIIFCNILQSNKLLGDKTSITRASANIDRLINTYQSNIQTHEQTTMPFWSRGSNESTPAAKDFSDSSADFQESIPISDPPSFSSSSGGGAAAEIQQFGAAIQQQMLIQHTITNLSDKAFEACITKPGESLSGREAACVQAVTLKWLDTNQFLVKRMEKKMSAGQREASF
jgi:hypothetical protein